jgi:hypothetical protein
MILIPHVLKYINLFILKQMMLFLIIFDLLITTITTMINLTRMILILLYF